MEDIWSRTDISWEEKQALHNQQLANERIARETPTNPNQLTPEQEAEKAEQERNFQRSVYMDAYRKYQAAVIYGEFQRVPVVDEFIIRLRDKDWSALDAVPPQLRYFNGEIGLAASGLSRP